MFHFVVIFDHLRYTQLNLNAKKVIFGSNLYFSRFQRKKCFEYRMIESYNLTIGVLPQPINANYADFKIFTLVSRKGWISVSIFQEHILSKFLSIENHLPLKRALCRTARVLCHAMCARWERLLPSWSEKIWTPNRSLKTLFRPSSFLAFCLSSFKTFFISSLLECLYFNRNSLFHKLDPTLCSSILSALSWSWLTHGSPPRRGTTPCQWPRIHFIFHSFNILGWMKIGTITFTPEYE